MLLSPTKYQWYLILDPALTVLAALWCAIRLRAAAYRWVSQQLPVRQLMPRSTLQPCLSDPVFRRTPLTS